MNTTALIAEWSMRGADDLSGFRSAGDLGDVDREAPDAPRVDPLLVRRHDASEWQPLLLAVREGERDR
jgi:hypothetical protein